MLKIKPTRFGKSAKKYLNGLTLEDFEKDKKFALKISNAFQIDNTMRRVKSLKRYNKTFSEIITIAPNLYEACEAHPNFVEIEINKGKFDTEIKKLEQEGITLRMNLIVLMHENHKSTEAIKMMKDIKEIEEYLGVVKHFFHTKNKNKAMNFINKIINIAYPGAEEKKKMRKHIDTTKIIEKKIIKKSSKKFKN